MQVDARLVEHDGAAARDADAAVGVSARRRSRARRPARVARGDDGVPRRRRAPARPRPAPRRTAPASGIAGAASSAIVEAAARRERHLGQRREQAAVGDVVIGEQRAVGDAAAARREERRQPRAVVEVRRVVAELPVDLRQRRAAQPLPAAAEIDPAAAPVSPASSRSCGVSVRRASRTGANAETISDTGAVTALSTPSSRHVVRIDIESLPTGID